MEENGLNEEHLNSPLTSAKIIFFIISVMFIVIYMCTFIDNRALHTDHRSMVVGVRRGLKMYSQTYDRSTEAMKTLGEGYIIGEDKKLSMDSNPLKVNIKVANRNFLEVLSANMVKTPDEIKAMNFYIIQVYTKFEFIGGAVNEKYTFSIYKLDSDTPMYICPGTLNGLQDVQNMIESQLNIKIDLNDAVNASLHKTVLYDKTGDFNTTIASSKSGSTFNTFICVGKGIPLRARFGWGLADQKVDVMELQSYATSR